jgi:hypothetical protein
MSEHIYDAITQQRHESKYQDDRLEAMIISLVIKLVKKEILDMDDAMAITQAKNIFEELNKEVVKK